MSGPGRIAAIAAVVIFRAGSAIAQTPDFQAQNLDVQERLATYTLWMTITSAFSAVFGLCSVLALVWTLNEQRKLVQTQSRALLEIVQGKIECIGADSRIRPWNVEITLRNAGNTHAFNVMTNMRLELDDHSAVRDVTIPKGFIADLRPRGPQRVEKMQTRLDHISPTDVDNIKAVMAVSRIVRKRAPPLKPELQDT